jgi:8-oxo-dGTP pyrophosphatase MutT (NUDIX family)
MPDRAALEHLLQAHTPRDATEREHRARMLALTRTPGDPFVRDHFVPGHFTASGFVVSPDSRALLLIHHRKLGRWLQPGGHVEVSDADLVSAARRELGEEVGLEDLPLESAGIFDLDVHAIPALGSEPAHEHFDVRFLFRAASLELGTGGDQELARWVPLHEIDALTSDRSVMRAVEKLLR